VLADCGQWRFKIRSVEQGVDSRRYFRAHGWAEATALQVDHNSKSHSLEFTPVRGRPVIGAFSRCEKGQFAAEIQWITRDGFSVSGREGLPPDVIGPMKVRCKQLGIDGLEDGDVDTNDD
jgi:hypothetical protein